jgi:hypothetical protein
MLKRLRRRIILTLSVLSLTALGGTVTGCNTDAPGGVEPECQVLGRLCGDGSECCSGKCTGAGIGDVFGHCSR